MAITVGVGRTFPGLGVSSLASNQANAGIPVASGTSYFIPATTAAATTAAVAVPTITIGRIRVKIYNGSGTSPTLTKLQISATDGTNTVVVADVNFGTAVTLSSTSWYDNFFDFLVDTAPSTTSGGAVGLLIGSASATSGNGGIQTIKIVPTLGGTGPACSMDLELLGLI
jgi:hypothetical protein